MSRYHIMIAFSTLSIISTSIFTFFVLIKDESFGGVRKVYFQPKRKNIRVIDTSQRFDRSQHFSNSPNQTVEWDTAEKIGKTVSKLQMFDADKFPSVTSDGGLPNKLTQSPPVGVKNSSNGLLFNSSISASENANGSVMVPNKLKRLRPMILKDFPSKFLPNYKNPCFFKFPDKSLRCLPFFFLLGTPKSGTTDIWSKIVSHPDILSPVVKEPHWWARESYVHKSLEYYERKYMTPQIVQSIRRDYKSKQRIITGDGSASTFWDNEEWQSIYPKYEKTGPPYIMADVIHTVLPNAKLLVSFREPTDRLHSDYMYFNQFMVKNPEDFHQKVETEIEKFSVCLTRRSLEACTYSSHSQSVRLNIGVYSLYLRDWLRRYPRDQFMILKLEEWYSNCTQLLPEIFQFLEVSSLPQERIALICQQPAANVNPKHNRLEPMLNSTRELLRNFYRPFVVRLASILNDDRFLWDYNDRHVHQT